MAGHMECIGIPIADQGSFVSTLGRILPAVQRMETRDDGGDFLEWTDGSGARVVVNADPDGAILCANPSFASTVECRIVPRSLGEDQCPFCRPLVADLVDGGGEMVYPLAFVVDDMGVADLVMDRPANARLAAFAEAIERRGEDEAAAADEPRLAAESLIPIGMFDLTGEAPHRASPHVLLSGHVAEADVRVNELTGERFQWSRVASYGAEYEVLSSPTDLAEPLEPGEVVQATCYLTGRIVAG